LCFNIEIEIKILKIIKKKLQSGILVCTDILSRGIDIEDVDWVIQYDPPKMVNSFVHRCGRTARSNREGNALVFLLPNEDSFVNFLAINQQVPLEKYENTNINDNECEVLLKKVQTMVSKERLTLLLSFI
jgi:ATP-dependent RNA helicase DDX55/SPB4